MGLIRGLLKYFLSALFISSLFSFAILYSSNKSLDKDAFISVVKASVKQEPAFAKAIDDMYNYSQIYFFYLNRTEDISFPNTGDGFAAGLKITKQDAGLGREQFADALIAKMASGVYNMELDTPFGKLSLGKVNGIIYKFSMLFLILAAALLAVMLLLFSSFVLTGMDFLLVAVFYFPIKFVFSNILGKMAPAEALSGLANSIFLNLYSAFAKIFFCYFIIGLGLIIFGIIFKLLKIGQRLRSRFGKKKAEG